MKRSQTFVSLFLAGFVALALTASVVSYRTRPQGLITNDGKTYYAWLRSLALDRDLDFSNDYRIIYPPEPLPLDTAWRTGTGRVANRYPVGLAVAASPGFAIGHAVAIVLGQPLNGVSGPYQFAITLWLQIFVAAGLWVLWRALVRLGSDVWISAIVMASTLACTNLLQYGARPFMPHGPGAAALCFALFFSARSRDAARRASDLFFAGLFLGLAVITRLSNVAFAPFFLALLAQPLRRSGRDAAAFFAPFVLALGVQVGLTSLLWGEFKVSGYVGEGFTSGASGVVSTLFSARHGLFSYHPWYALALAVTVLGVRRESTRVLSMSALASFLLLAVINGTWWCWWFGDSFGNRAFVEVIPILATTAALSLSSSAAHRERLMRVSVAATLAMAVLNFVLWTGYIFHRYPADGTHTRADAYLWPLR